MRSSRLKKSCDGKSLLGGQTGQQCTEPSRKPRIDAEHDENDVNNIDSLEPPYVMKKYHTSLGLPSLDQRSFPGRCENNNITQANRFNTLSITSAKSPQNFRNISPHSIQILKIYLHFEVMWAGSLLDPLPYSPLKLYDQKNLRSCRNHNLSNHIPILNFPPPPSSHGSDLLKTPKMRHSDGLENPHRG
nr:AAC_HP1_G0006620.mRNA.1.CDS.1 [Saccharomyces cerevisiae]